jgi:hypothetical protein
MAVYYKHMKKKKKDNFQSPKHKILIIGDSHDWGMADKLCHNLKEDYSAQGLVKADADLAAILSSGVKDIKDLTKNDMLAVWGGTADVSRNETGKGLTQIRNFVRENTHTNVIVMNLTNRQDLAVISCVNHEIKVFNRKLSKYMKVFDYASALEV